ncbi:MAG: hypothetical protein EXX96DRAFT_558415 [Benjaminiella poitrasii]|nr:MAG: hypothetical protein EXX96DRAFT_558415 [Benjaminiella poitrasii]
MHKNNKNEYDIVSDEIAIDDTKIVLDEGKICRETKDTIDIMISLVGNPVQGFGMQCAGSTCLVTVQSLARSVLYVYLPFFTFSVPTCVRDLQSFLETFQKLITLEKHVLQTSQLLQHHMKEKQNFKSLGTHEENDLEEPVLGWRRKTFYSPPNKNAEPRIPQYIFGAYSSGFISRLLSAKHSEGENLFRMMLLAGERKRTNGTTKLPMKHSVRALMVAKMVNSVQAYFFINSLQ